jgi:hypothetical protein
MGLRGQGILPVVDLLPEINHLEQLMKLLEGALLFFLGRLLRTESNLSGLPVTGSTVRSRATSIIKIRVSPA